MGKKRLWALLAVIVSCVIPQGLAAETLKIASPIRGSWEGAIPELGKQAGSTANLEGGGSLENAVVIDGDRILNPEGLRRPDEFVRHKALDAVGDLYTLGAPILGRFEGVYAGHALNNLLCRALLAQPRAWRLVSGVDLALAEAV